MAFSRLLDTHQQDVLLRLSVQLMMSFGNKFIRQFDPVLLETYEFLFLTNFLRPVGVHDITSFEYSHHEYVPSLVLRYDENIELLRVLSSFQEGEAFGQVNLTVVALNNVDDILASSKKLVLCFCCSGFIGSVL